MERKDALALWHTWLWRWWLWDLICSSSFLGNFALQFLLIRKGTLRIRSLSSPNTLRFYNSLGCSVGTRVFCCYQAQGSSFEKFPRQQKKTTQISFKTDLGQGRAEQDLLRKYLETVELYNSRIHRNFLLLPHSHRKNGFLIKFLSFSVYVERPQVKCLEITIDWTSRLALGKV